METIKDLNLLIISYYFPPYDKVGGRRWAKHCKYLKKAGMKFHVLAGDFSDKSPWDKDIVTYHQQITRVKPQPIFIPFHLKLLPENIFQKIRWKLSLIIWQALKKMLKGNYFDPSRKSSNRFFRSAAEIISQEKISTVLLSCGPFSYSGIIPHLKKRFPGVKFVLDFRDYWEDVFKGLTGEQIENEKKLMSAVIKSCDLIIAVNSEMVNFYARNTGKETFILPHCYDPEDIIPDRSEQKKDQEIKLIYGGAFYAEIESNLSLIRKLLTRLSQSHEVKSEFYVSTAGYDEQLSHPAIQRKGFLDTHSYFNKVINSDYVILLLPPNRVNAMSSKFFELVALKKPILYFGGDGQFSDYILKNALGFHITEENLQNNAE